MKIRTRLTLKYTLVTAAIISALVFTVIVFAEKNREKEFYLNLKAEAVTKANLFLNGNVDAEVMHSIYMNNREFINESEVAVYDLQYNLVYHDASQIDIVKETPDMFRKIIEGSDIEFYEDRYQVVGLVYEFEGERYIVTAAAYDGYGYAKQNALSALAIGIWIAGMLLLILSGYFLSRSALSPVSKMVDEMDTITGSNLDKRLEVLNPNDELGEMAQTFNGMLDRLEKSFNNQRMFVSNISHELRTPLAALIAELEVVLMRDRTTDEYRQAVLRSLSDAKKIERLSSGMLDLARADYESGQISLKDIRIDELLLDARETVLKANQGYHVELIFEENLENEELITVRGNEYLLKTAFVNLIDNNCKFSDDNTSFVHISYYGDNTILRFADTGIGLSKEDASNIFQPFFRGSNSTNISGHGIGMALVKKIIDLHAGNIEVHSHVGEGTVFICEIPHL